MRAFGHRTVLWVGNFVAQFHFYLVAFVLSSFLAPFVGIDRVGYVFVGSSIIVALTLFAAPAIFRSFGTRNVLSALGLVEIGVLLSFVLVFDPLWLVILITLQAVISYAIFIGLDLLIEASTTSEIKTGNTRGAFLLFNNVAVFLAALALSFIVAGDDYSHAFVAAAFVMVPFLIISLTLMPSISHPGPVTSSRSFSVQFPTNPTVRRITFAHLLLQVFFSWMGVYIPILLHLYEGFAWSEVGLILALAMTPYIVLELPLGIIADRWLGEKEILITGFIIIIISLVAFSILHGAGFWVWAAVMILSRIGAAMVEAMTEIHFFRHVDQNDSDTITTFRALRPAGSVVGLLIASAALILMPLSAAFAVFAVVMIAGVPLALSIVDSK